MRRTPPPALASPAPLSHCKSDSNLSSPPSTASIAVPKISREHATSDPNITTRNRKKKDEISRAEILEMFSKLQKEQDEKFSALMNKVQGGINAHTEQNRDISCSIDFLGLKYEELITRINTLEQDKSEDRRYIKSLEARLERLDRSLHSSCIEVRNVPKKSGETKEDLLSLIKKVGNAVSAPFQSSEVRDIYRVNTKNENNQPIVAEFSTVILRDKIIGSVKSYNKKYATGKLSTEHLKLDGPPKPIFVSESLTIQAKKLFFMAREFAKGNEYKFCWASRGRIYLRRSDGATLIKVNNESDLENLLNK